MNTIVRAVIFDLFDTLVPFPLAFWQETALLMGRAVCPDGPERFVEWWTQDAAHQQRMSEPLPSSLRRLCDERGLFPSAEAIAGVLGASRRLHERLLGSPRADALDVLGQLRLQRVRLGLISNCSSDAAEVWPSSQLAPYFDVTLFSAVEGIMKPDARIYRAALARLGVRPDETIYVDDHVIALAGAAAVGLRTVQLRSAGVERDSWNGERIDELSLLPGLLSG